MSLQDKLDAHRKLAEGAAVPNGYRKPRGKWRIWFGTVVAGRGGKDFFTVCPHSYSSSFSGRELKHIAANDPDTVLALIAVAEAARSFEDAETRKANFEQSSTIDEQAALYAALANLEAVLP